MKVEQPDVGFLVNQMEMLEQQPLGWQYQPAKDTRNKVSQIMTCFLLLKIEQQKPQGWDTGWSSIFDDVTIITKA